MSRFARAPRCSRSAAARGRRPDPTARGSCRCAPGIDVADLAPSNAGFEIALPAEPDGRALKNVALLGSERVAGDVTITRYGIEGTPVYCLSPLVRAAPPPATIALDLKPDLEEAAIARRLAAGGSKKSLSTRLAALRLDATARALLRLGPRETDAAAIARRVKSLPLTVTALRPLAEAISSAGGVRWSALDDVLMLRVRPGVFVAGEMIDWEAPTGGYLLQACVSTGRAAGAAAAIRRDPP